MKPQQTSSLFQRKNSQSSPKNGKIIEVLWELKKAGRAEPTIKNISKCLHRLAQYADLDNPESVKAYIATADKKHGYKRNLTYAYDQYVKIHGLTWTRPFIIKARKCPRYHTKKR